VGNFYTEHIRSSPFFCSAERVFVPDLLEPRFRSRIVRIVAKAKMLGVDLRIFETYRSRERQFTLYKAGRTQLKNVGVHHYGLACDLVRDVDGKPSWEADYRFMASLCSQEQVVWGGDWGNPAKAHAFVDEVHVQAIAVRDQARLLSDKWYPSSSYEATR
jgi:hypothetical protein